MGGDHKRRSAPWSASARSWALPLALIAVCGGLWLAGEPADRWLAYDRRSVLEDGQLWRLVTAHLLHLNLAHLAMNAAAAVLIWALLGRAMGAAGWCATALFVAVGTGAGLALLAPDVTGYVGLSGVLHGLVVAGAIAQSGERRAESALLLVAVATKIAFEMYAGPSGSTETLIGGRVIVDAHAFGALSGAVPGLAARSRPPR